MSELLISIGAFLVTLGILVTIHEFGHFGIARSLGVKVLRFSVGFGKPIWSRRTGIDQTEYAIGLIPLGGYVNMLDENEAPVCPDELPRAFNRQSPIRRIAIVIAGPLANLLFAIFAYWLMFMIGVTGMRPLLGGIDSETPAAMAGFQSGEEITFVENRPTPTWDGVTLALIQEATADRDLIRIETIDPTGIKHVRILNLSGVNLDKPGAILARLGLRLGYPTVAPIIESVELNAPAFNAGIKPGDKIIGADGQPISSWEQWVKYIRARPGQDIHIVVERAGIQENLIITPKSSGTNQQIGYIGATVRLPEGYQDRVYAQLRYPPGTALIAALNKSWEMTILTLRMLSKMVGGTASMDNISGPLSIAQLAGKSAAIGLSPFLAFLALVSLSLGILNLLPIPLLDGGHIFHYLIEIAIGAPLPERVIKWGQQLGMAILFGLMSLALFNDLNRIFGPIFGS